MKRWALCTKKNIVWDNWRIEGFYDQFLDLRQLLILGYPSPLVHIYRCIIVKLASL